MTNILKVKSFSLNIKVFLSFLVLGFLLLTVLFLLIIPRMQQEKYDLAQIQMERMIDLTKEQVILAGKSIEMQSILEIKQVKYKLERDLAKNNSLPEECSVELLPNNKNIVLNIWQKEYITDRFTKRNYYNIFYTKSTEQNRIKKVKCDSLIFNKNHSPFEKDIKKNIQKSFALTSKIHKGTSYLIWINKKYKKDNSPLYSTDIDIRKQKYMISNMSNIDNIYTSTLSPKEIIESSNKGPVFHILDNKEAVTWTNIISDSKETYFMLITTAYKEDFDNYTESVFWKILPASLISLFIAIIAGFFILKGLLKELQSSIEEKEILLKEIHHRVKNNLALTISLIKLQQYKIEDTKTKNILKDIQERIYTMELLHRKLYESKNLNHILVKDYIENLVTDISKTYTNIEGVKLKFDIDEIYCDIETVLPCALIINEITTNAFKYAFKNNETPILQISVKKENEKYEMCIRDNGLGIPSNIDIYKTNTLGLKLINSISKRQLGGELEYKYDNGAVFLIRF